MAYEASQPLKISLEAAADLSTNQYCFVKLDTAGKAAAIAANTDVPIGVLQNKPTSGQMAEITVLGVTKIYVDDSVTADEASLIGPGVAATVKGRARINAEGTDTTKHVAGQFLTAGAAGTVQTAVVNCVFAPKAT